MSRRADSGFDDDLKALDIECLNCGRTRRLGRPQLRDFIGAGIRSVEDLGRRLSCRECAAQGKVSKNVTIMPRYRCDRLGDMRL